MKQFPTDEIFEGYPTNRCCLTSIMRQDGEYIAVIDDGDDLVHIDID